MADAIRLIRLRADIDGIRALRASREVDEHLEDRARRVAEAAEAVYGAIGHGDVTTEVLQRESDTSEPRARVAVIARHPAALRIEAEHRVLGGSLDAARG